MNSGCADERGGIWLLHVHISGAVCTYLEYMKVRVRVNRAARQVVATACARLTQAGAANKCTPTGTRKSIARWLCGVGGGPGFGLFGLGGGFFPADRDQLGDAGLLHGYAVEDRAHFHGFAVVGYYDELSLRAHFLEHFVEAAYVGFVQRGVHFVQNAERAWLIAENRDEQSQ